MTNRKVMAAAVTGSLLAGGALGLIMFGPSLASAQTGGTTSPSAATAPAVNSGSGGAFTSNEDPAHEASESPEREAAENSGTAFGGNGGHHGWNEDPAHEASESPQREAEEDAANAASGGSSSSTAPAADSGTSSLQ
ncbi:MAG TPA: hypothetical protein VGP90_13650 [Acidimicrobiia bacterium]|jgi:hypothetical protein|nr:hypothetical protein [Acidimicrobiia bacterium]